MSLLKLFDLIANNNRAKNNKKGHKISRIKISTLLLLFGP